MKVMKRKISNIFSQHLFILAMNTFDVIHQKVICNLKIMETVFMAARAIRGIGASFSYVLP